MKSSRKLGLPALLAVVMGDMIGSGIFFTPGELAAVATQTWHVYFFWGLCGLITLLGALTLAELSTLIPKAGVSYHALTSAFGPFAGFMQAWVMLLVGGPGAIAGVAILFGKLANQALGSGPGGLQLVWAVAAIGFFVLINLRGAQWGGRTQVVLTSIKVIGLLVLVVGGLFIAAPATSPAPPSTTGSAGSGALAFFRLIGSGVAIVLFTYDGWVDASNVAGEVKDPGRNFPRAMAIGVALITVIYLLVNHAFLRVVPLAAMKANPTMVAPTVATAAFGELGGRALTLLMGLSIFGALGGLIMTLPRLFHAAAEEYRPRAEGTPLAPAVRAIAFVSPARGVPTGAILVAAGVSIAALMVFGSFSKIVAFFVVPFQLMNILMVASIFVLRPKLSSDGGFRTPGYPVVPAVFIFVMSLFLLAAIVFNPIESLIGVALTLTGVPVYRVLMRGAEGTNDG